MAVARQVQPANSEDIRSLKIACAGGGKTAQQGGDKRGAAAGGTKQKQQ